jgi:hypothetical protein
VTQVLFVYWQLAVTSSCTGCGSLVPQAAAAGLQWLVWQLGVAGSCSGVAVALLLQPLQSCSGCGSSNGPSGGGKEQQQVCSEGGCEQRLATSHGDSCMHAGHSRHMHTLLLLLL